ncbi:MAG TPA: type II toxin-antitoxin system RelE/ParE family toxin [Candidatus Atribacteria bacterium]|nr:type II toxin-antitoxin system RelE/ParE family toxin [Candidatus Atribacteria bacterium]
MARIEWTEEAVRDLKVIEKQVGRRILKKLSWFSENFETIVPEPLSGEFKETYKLRVGDWRVIYTIENGVIVIQSIGHRREIYKIQ